MNFLRTYENPPHDLQQELKVFQNSTTFGTVSSWLSSLMWASSSSSWKSSSRWALTATLVITCEFSSSSSSSHRSSSASSSCSGWSSTSSWCWLQCRQRWWRWASLDMHVLCLILMSGWSWWCTFEINVLWIRLWYLSFSPLQVWFGLSEIQTKLAGLGLTDSQAELEDQQIPRWCRCRCSWWPWRCPWWPWLWCPWWPCLTIHISGAGTWAAIWWRWPTTTQQRRGSGHYRHHCHRHRHHREHHHRRHHFSTLS